MAFYKMTGPNSTFPFPLLDQPVNKTIEFFSKEELHANWSRLYFNVGGRARKHALSSTNAAYNASKFTSFGNYTNLGRKFKDAFLKAASPHTQFKYASISYKYYTDLSKHERFRKDKYFSHLRLAGLNPMAIRRVTLSGKSGTNYHNLLRRLNSTFDWDREITSITGDSSTQESIECNKVYVVEYPGLEGITQMPDYFLKHNPHKIMRNNPAQIALFAVDLQKRLRPVAIQNSTTKAGHVFTPRDGLLWEISRAELQISDVFYASNVEHLLKTHIKMEPICISIQRHLSKLHPLHQILQYHCLGLIPVNAFGLQSLLENLLTYRSLFSHGNEGARQLLLTAYEKMVWNDADLEWNIQERGMEDREQIPYYPYRDDGRLVNNILHGFADELVDLYYARDRDVRRDYELQNMIGELSQNKKSKNANKISKVKGLPSRFRRRWQLKKFVRQFLWVIVQHSILSYSVGEFFQSPIYPSKLYDSRTNAIKLEFVQMLPGPLNAALQESLASGVTTLHYDSMFSYWKHLKSRKLKFLVKSAYKNLAIAQHYITRRNRRRYIEGLLTNPFMTRNWMPSSICT